MSAMPRAAASRVDAEVDLASVERAARPLVGSSTPARIFDERRLAGAVLADERVHAAALEAEVDVAERRRAAEGLRDLSAPRARTRRAGVGVVTVVPSSRMHRHDLRQAIRSRAVDRRRAPERHRRPASDAVLDGAPSTERSTRALSAFATSAKSSWLAKSPKRMNGSASRSGRASQHRADLDRRRRAGRLPARDPRARGRRANACRRARPCRCLERRPQSPAERGAARRPGASSTADVLRLPASTRVAQIDSHVGGGIEAVRSPAARALAGSRSDGSSTACRPRAASTSATASTHQA